MLDDAQIGRRTVMKGLAGASFAAVLADPVLARAAAEETEAVSLTLGSDKTVQAALALPETLPAPTVLLIHEWWGLNDQIKATARAYAANGYVALAIDLMGGSVATTPDAAQTQMANVDADEATETCTAWMAWLRNHEASNGTLGTVGWCFGGGWSLNASLAAPSDATVIYYGRLVQEAEPLKALKGPVLGHFATRDGYINADMVGGFERAMAEAGKADSLTVHWYDADHAFANPSGSRYDEEDAKLSWARTMAFFAQHLKG
ncbi:dienelactone hydrolase family protein [Roseospira marina]|uniref:Dienelactone hydrolase family protein n=1 Tax=Roseospira marina TaxID=140057 RepID=A0A5M6IC24_9PROT|nr:dienelactone hydrolase family protein [Roseospira marina]KAA5605840.1 dienelactone hydrolase family protein [Roseospira marina]MBB4313659.1 carboxymethylenebutenolidase [Roseospira marina]MBB5086821.1 carboxymethylenebutenolidase [Roseospira marina]